MYSRLVFTLTISLALALPISADAVQCRFGYGLMECAGRACAAIPYRIGLALLGRRADPLADLMTRPRFRKILPIVRDGLGEISQMAEQSPQFRHAFVNLLNGLPEEMLGPAFTKLFKKPAEGVVLIRSLGDVGLLRVDVKEWAKDLVGKTPDDQGSELRARAEKFIAHHIGNFGPSISRLFNLTERLDERASGAIFEEWLNQHYFKNGLGRLDIPTRGLAGSYQTTRIKSDNLIDDGASMTLVEAKHLRTSQDFGDREEKQMKNYNELITKGVKHAESGKTYKKVIYVFSSRAAAEKNLAMLRRELGTNASVLYFDRDGSRLAEMPL